MSINKNAELLPYYQKAKKLLNYDPKTGRKLSEADGKFKKGHKLNDKEQGR